MIALRGTIRHKDGYGANSRSPCPSPTPSSSIDPRITTTDTTTTTTTTTADSANDPQSIQPGEWVWTGHWAFGSLPPSQVLDEAIGHHQKKKRPLSGVRPFVYKFQHVKDAKDVVIPSLSFLGGSSTRGGGDDVDGEGGGRDDDNANNNKTKDEVMDDDNDSNDNNGNLNKAQEQSSVNEDADELMIGEKAEVDDKMEIDVKVASQDQCDHNDDKKKESQDKMKESELNSESELKQKENSKNDKTVIQIEEEKKELDDINIDEETKEEITAEHSKNEYSNKVSTNDVQQSSTDVPTNAGETFATIANGGIFTDAGQTYPKVCPVGGCWKGYFENVSVSWT